jgi:hypothetical protein
MDSEQTVGLAISHFEDWSHPWKFFEFVRASLNVRDQSLFDVIWHEANRFDHWDSPTLQDGAANAERGLKQTFPGLKQDAIKAVANAAAYQWK